MPDAFYLPDGDRFVPTDHTIGPWSRSHQHGGPPAALLVRAVERLDDPVPRRLARLTVEIARPIPTTPLQVRTEVRRDGRSVRVVHAELVAGDTVVSRAEALLLTASAVDDALPDDPISMPTVARPEDSTPFVFPFPDADSRPGYHRAMDVRIARGVYGEGPVAAWFRMTVPLLAGETPSGAMRAAIAADSGNGISPTLDWGGWTFINPDLTMALYREPVGEWVLLDARTDVHPDGVGLASSGLYDARGACGTALQTLLVARR